MLRYSRAVLLHFTLLAVALAGCAAPAPPAPTSTPLPTASPAPMPTSAADWLIIDLPANATQQQYGAEVYRLVCQDCHGDKGQGLTPAWRATWAPQDQNCWQSKCHNATHPPEGFILPIAPAIVGPAVLARYSTARDLYAFIQAEMPWYRPGSLIPKDAWAVTAHVLVMNQLDPGTLLDAQSAANILLK